MDSKSPALRLFISIHVPDAVRKKLRAIQRQFENSMPDDAVCWTAFEQLHLTLEFLGGVPAAEIAQLEQALRKVAGVHQSFRLAAESIGAFSSVRNPRVIWAGITGDIDRLKA